MSHKTITEIQIRHRLEKYHPQYIDLSLQRIKRLLKSLGNPEQKCPNIIHIAGTNGKGSTLAFLSSMLKAEGKTVNSYTSPHLISFNERITLNGQNIENDELELCLTEVEKKNNGQETTYFEMTTALAFLAFSRHPADYLLLEVGLGGRLDATNVISTVYLAIITSISYDHEEFLGDNLEKITTEKLGILKPHCSAIIAKQDKSLYRHITNIAEEKNTDIKLYGQDWSSYIEHNRLIIQYETGLMDLPLPQLVGDFQIDNASTACMAALTLGVSQDSIAKGVITATWPARLQRLTKSIWLDGGHNPAAAKTLAQWIKEYDQPVNMICGMMKHKSLTEWWAAFTGLPLSIYTIPIPNQDCFTAQELTQQAQKSGLQTQTCLNLQDALKKIGVTRERILICGSLYLAGDTLKNISDIKPFS